MDSDVLPPGRGLRRQPATIGPFAHHTTAMASFGHPAGARRVDLLGPCEAREAVLQPLGRRKVMLVLGCASLLFSLLRAVDAPRSAAGACQ